MMQVNASRMPVLFVPHGGGPMPLLNDVNHRELRAFLTSVTAPMPTPKAIVLITAHWEESVVTLSSSPKPSILYDYYGFPPEAYQLTYPAPGEPELAAQIANMLADKGITTRLDSERAFDHGTFVPLKLMYPEANIPVVQMSLVHSLDPKIHITIGEALAPLRDQGVLIVGSGMSFHNMRAFFSSDLTVQSRSAEFDHWLTQTLTASVSSAEVKAALTHWQSAPEARFSHPREEHLLPLHVCFGAGHNGSSHAERNFNGILLNTLISGYIWQ
ncbi:dioxygenase [Shewanella sp. SW36]|uniref:DODA-type extradiol aromatic ring-opening family dioxygenase n=1 Tax=unclassified Shewanella TaxID=196818 RepID=UPI0021DA6841|nr:MULTISPECIES: class III extradiol ring-cleavage dioxygenase [unclassified Shewanella]MCU7975836.1 dioxygenase [Shewanella sp. SW36]MCU7991226.1 dioxygenase [Shewanella sp. SW1]MCU8017928.1 dioxygenase [Shewanella sp. SM72]MCU8052463.1 dioxygenase [Shewanella sp. SM43]